MELIDETEINCAKNQFYEALKVFLFKQQVINRKLSCVTTITIQKLSSSSEIDSKTIIDNLIGLDNYSEESISKILASFDVNHENCAFESISSPKNNSELFLIVLKLLPRNVVKFKQIFLICVINTANTSVLITPSEETQLSCNVPVQLEFNNGMFRLLTSDDPGI